MHIYMKGFVNFHAMFQEEFRFLKKMKNFLDDHLLQDKLNLFK